MSKNIFVIETALSGHRGPYLKWIVEAFLDNGDKVILAIPEKYIDDTLINSLKHENLKIYFFKHVNFKTLKLFQPIINELLNYKEFKKTYLISLKSYDINFVFIPFIDHVFYSISLFGSPFRGNYFSGISMRPDFHYKKLGLEVPVCKYAFIKKWLFEKFIKNQKLSWLLTLDEPLYRYCKQKKINKLCFLPEPAEVIPLSKDLNDELKENLKLSSCKKIILVFGSLTERKGIIHLIESVVSKINELNIQLVMAGKASDKIRKYFSNDKLKKYLKDNSILFIDRFLSAKEEAVLYSSAYISWLGYNNHFRASGVLITSAKYSVPVIATNQGVIGWQVERYKLGCSVNVNSNDEVLNGIIKLCSDDIFYSGCVENTKKAFQANTLSIAKSIVVQTIK